MPVSDDRPPAQDPDDPWLPLGAASRLVGVGPDTLRRWADTGKVQSYQTPGGHRRFLRSSLEAMINAPRRARYGMERLPDSTQTMAGELHRRMQRTGYSSQPWQARLSAAETVEAFLFFRSPVLDAITGHLRRRSAEVSEVTAAFHEANAAIDQVLVALVSSHRERR